LQSKHNSWWHESAVPRGCVDEAPHFAAILSALR
jgi:hypothetical protein